ncbi:MAG TPA: transposase, partial [Nocardioides sp.]|nr:transposase [Nocardioides sp.]
MRAAVLTADQRGSTRAAAADRIPPTQAALADLSLLRPFERTAGDEFQGVVTDPAALAAAVERLLREDAWSIGIGIGTVEEPLPESTRAGRGPAYVHAREA